MKMIYNRSDTVMETGDHGLVSITKIISIKKLYILFLCILMCAANIPCVFAAPVWGEIFEMPNNYIDKNGKEISCKIKVKVWGDEFYTHVETLDGYTLIRDPQTFYICYAIQGSDGDIVSSKIIYTGTGTKEELEFERANRKQVKESIHKINEKAGKNKERLGTHARRPVPPPKSPIKSLDAASSSNPYYNPYYAGSINNGSLKNAISY